MADPGEASVKSLWIGGRPVRLSGRDAMFQIVEKVWFRGVKE